MQDASSDSDLGENESPKAIRRKATSLGKEEQKSLIVRTAFDAYFTQAASSRTSSNVFSALVPPLSAEEFAGALPPSNHSRSSICAEFSHRPLFSRFLRELDEGFNLLFYGLGSKRTLVNQFSAELAKRGHVVVVNGYHPDFHLKDMFNAIENIPEMSSLPRESGIENQVRRVCDVFGQEPSKRRLYLAIHNIDSPPFRTAKAKSLLSLLALNPGIHLVASVDRITAPLLWSSTELSKRKEGYGATDQLSPSGFSWLMHDLTTLLPYDTELSYADRSSISGAHGKAPRNRETGAAVSQQGPHMTETAALHILASVTQKARKLFVLMGTRQLDGIEEAGDQVVGDFQRFAIGYDMLFNLARDNFIATSDAALQSLLGEFRDHGLVMTAPRTTGNEESLWIPLRKERLSNILQSLKEK